MKKPTTKTTRPAVTPAALPIAELSKIQGGLSGDDIWGNRNPSLGGEDIWGLGGDDLWGRGGR